MKAIIYVGISASGKTVFAESYVKNRDDWININRDDIRFNLFCGGERNWSKYKWKHEKKVTEVVNAMIKNAAIMKQNIISSDTNLNPKYRNILIDKLEGLGYEVEIKEFPVDLEEAYKRDKLRPNSVGYDVIYKQWLQWNEYIGRKKYEPDYFLQKAVLVDVDGTIARMVNRGPFDWAKVNNDEPILEVMDIVDGLEQQGYKIVFLSGRDECCYKQTYDWLDFYFGFPIELYMRPEGDCRKDYVVKEELFWNHVADKYNVKLVLDDRMQVVERCWHPLGIKVVNVGNPNERF